MDSDFLSNLRNHVSQALFSGEDQSEVTLPAVLNDINYDLDAYKLENISEQTDERTSERILAQPTKDCKHMLVNLPELLLSNSTNS